MAGWSVESVGHLLVMLSPHVDHRRSATSQPALRRTGASSGSLSLMDLFFLKAFARVSLQEVTQAAFATLQKVEKLKKNLTVRICEDLVRNC